MNARVYNNSFAHPGGIFPGEKIFRVRVSASDAVVIDPKERKKLFRISPTSTHPTFYGDSNSEWSGDIENALAKVSRSVGVERKVLKHSTRLERQSAARKLALSKFGSQCACCGLKGAKDTILDAVFEVHHLYPFARGVEQERELVVDDLTLLCANCHRQIHKMPDVSDVDALRKYLEK